MFDDVSDSDDEVCTNLKPEVSNKSSGYELLADFNYKQYSVWEPYLDEHRQILTEFVLRADLEYLLAKQTLKTLIDTVQSTEFSPTEKVSKVRQIMLTYRSTMLDVSLDNPLFTDKEKKCTGYVIEWFMHYIVCLAVNLMAREDSSDEEDNENNPDSVAENFNSYMQNIVGIFTQNLHKDYAKTRVKDKIEAILDNVSNIIKENLPDIDKVEKLANALA